MALRLAVEMSDTFAAVASVAGAQPPLDTEPLEPVSVVLIHGTHDEYVPYNGGNGAKSPRSDIHMYKRSRNGTLLGETQWLQPRPQT